MSLIVPAEEEYRKSLIKVIAFNLKDAEAETQVEKAEIIARIAHGGQFDKVGVAYVEHVLAVAKGFHNNKRATGLLHDVVEDTPLTFDDLLELGVSQDVVDGVDACTKRDGEKYFDSIERGLPNAFFRAVKPRDNQHNSDMSRLPEGFVPSDNIREKWEFIYPLSLKFIAAADEGRIPLDCKIGEYVFDSGHCDVFFQNVDRLQPHTSHDLSIYAN